MKFILNWFTVALTSQSRFSLVISLVSYCIPWEVRLVDLKVLVCKIHAIFQVLTALLRKIHFCSVIALYRLVRVYQRLEGTYCPHLQGQSVHGDSSWIILPEPSKRRQIFINLHRTQHRKHVPSVYNLLEY